MLLQFPLLRLRFLSDEALVLVVRLIPVAVLLLGLKLGRQLLEDDLEQLLPSRLVVRVTSPYGNLHRIPADRVREATNVVVECCDTLASALLLHMHMYVRV